MWYLIAVAFGFVVGAGVGVIGAVWGLTRSLPPPEHGP